MPLTGYRKLVGAVCGAAALLLFSCLAPVRAAEDPAATPSQPTNIVTIISGQSQVFLTETESRILSTKARIKTVDGFDEKVIKVTATDRPNQIRVVGTTAGLTQLILVDEAGETFTVEVLVSGDVKHLEATIRRAFPDASVQVTKVKESVLLTGYVNQPDQLTTIVSIAEQWGGKVINYLRVNGIQTVMLRVKIMEVQRGRIRNLGFNFLHLQNGNYITSSVGALAPLASLAVPGVGQAPSAALNGGTATATLGVISNSEVFQGFIEALKQESLLKILAEPNLIAINGRPSSFLSGGEFPILVPGGLGTVTVQFKPFGVRLEFVPTVLGNGRVRLDVAPEVSEKDFSNTVTVGTTIVPGLTARRANTQVEMSFGETLVIAGLISNRVQARTQKIPFLGELPWIGSAFRRVSHDESETELLIIVTPELAAPMDESTVPQGGPGADTVSPTDGELYGQGVMEVKKFGPDPISDLNDNQANAIQPVGYVSGQTGEENRAAPTSQIDDVRLPPPLPADSFRTPGAGTAAVRRGSTQPLVAPEPRSQNRNGLLPPNGTGLAEENPLDGEKSARRGLDARRFAGGSGSQRGGLPAANVSRSRTRPSTRPGYFDRRPPAERTPSSEVAAPPGLIGPTANRN